MCLGRKELKESTKAKVNLTMPEAANNLVHVHHNDHCAIPEMANNLSPASRPGALVHTLIKAGYHFSIIIFRTTLSIMPFTMQLCEL